MRARAFLAGWMMAAAAAPLAAQDVAVPQVGAQARPETAPQPAPQQTVTSPKPDAVNVTIYRDPNRDGGEINRNWLNGFALITETRTIAIPAGESRVRFEGVAEGMVAVSAVVTGLPGGVVQKNRDAALLSPAALLDGTLGNRVTVKRVNPGTGKIEEQQAIIRSGPGGAVVLQTDKGYESLRCSGLPETLVYSQVPEGLTAKPTLSVITRSDAPVTAKVTLTYLATGFDWAANYVATVNPDGRTLDLFAWLTVANSNAESFPDAQMMAVAGKLNKERDYRELVTRQPPPRLNLSCYPTGSGREGLERNRNSLAGAPPPPPPPPPPMMAAPVAEMAMDEVVVTASRVARQEDLGDLKLYRVPMAVTVAAKQQKQVALLVKDDVPYARLYKAWIAADNSDQTITPTLILRLRNEEKDGLGVPLPSGGIAVFEQVGGARILAGRDRVTDYAVKEEIEVKVSQSPTVTVEQMRDEKDRVTVTVSNANPYPVALELGIGSAGESAARGPSQKLRRKDGVETWFATVPANGKAVLRYKVKRAKD